MIADETAPRVTDVDEAENVTDGSLDEVTGNDEATSETEAKSESQPRDGIVRRSAKATWTRLGVIMLAVVLVASAGVAEQVVTPAAKQKSVKTSASVVRAAVSEMHPDSAVVLVFINQITTSKENPDGAFAASAVKVGLKKISDAWLISSFDPV